MEIKIDIDLEKFRYSLVGDGYLIDEVEKMSHGELINILKHQLEYRISSEYEKSMRLVAEMNNRKGVVTYGDIYKEFSDNYPTFAKEVNDWRPYFPPYTRTDRPMNIMLWMNDGETKRYSYETKKLYPDYAINKDSGDSNEK